MDLLGSWLAKKLGDEALKGSLKGAIKIFTPDEINTQFKKCLGEVSKELKEKYPKAFGGDIKFYLQNDKIVDALFKMMFIDADIDEKVLRENIDFDTLPPEFLTDLIEKLKAKLLSNSKISPIISSKEIYTYLCSVGENTKNIYEVVYKTSKELEIVRNHLESRFINKFSYSSFLERYSENTKTIICDVNFFGLGIEQSYKKPRVNLKKIFVKPIFKYKINNTENDKIIALITKSPKESQQYFIETNNLLDIHKQIVVLGNPGAGKSLLIKAIMYSILYKDKDILGNEYDLDSIPFRIELRKYSSFKRNNGKNLLHYLVHILNNEYSIDFIKHEDLSEILISENVLMLFDGLDEIFNIEEKNNVRNDIINFIKSYKVKSIVTSRFNGYDDAKLDDRFIEIEMQDFTDEQISEYVSKWYDIEEVSPETRLSEISEFNNAKKQLSEELLRNPLLLSLIVILYRNNLRLPESKLEIYQSCTKTLVDKWDSIKQLEISVDKELLERKETVLADLAIWQYQVLSEKPEKLTYNTALDTITHSISNRLKSLDDWSYVKNIANLFMEYIEKRSIYFDNNFTHKTFLEYFAAFWIYSNFDKKHLIDKRNDIVDKYIDNPFWFIVFELLFNMIDNEQPDEEIIDGIYQRQINRGNSTFEFLISALPSLKNISRNQIKILFTSVSSHLLDNYNEVILEKNENQLKNSSAKRRRSRVSRGNLFDSYETLLIDSKYEAIFLEASLELYSTNKYSKVQVYSITYELLSRNRRENRKDVVYDYFYKQSPDLYEVIITTPFSFISYLYSIKDFDALTVEMLKFLDIYKIKSIFNSYHPLFNSWEYIPVLRYAFIILIQSKSYDKFDEFIQSIISNRISKDVFLKKSASILDGLYFELDKSDLKSILIASEMQKDYVTKTLLILIFICIALYAKIYKRRSDFDLDDLIEYSTIIENTELRKHIVELITFDKFTITSEVQIIKLLPQVVELVKSSM